jgi:hypothetical protein
MRGLVNRMAEGTLKGWLLRYTRYHIHHCTRCRKAVEALKGLIGRLRGSRGSEPVSLAPDRWSEVSKQWDSKEAEALGRTGDDG